MRKNGFFSPRPEANPVPNVRQKAPVHVPADKPSEEPYICR